MTDLLTRAESNALFDALWQCEKNADGDDKVLYRTIAEKLDNLVISGALAESECEHPNLKHAEGDSTIAFCPDCELEFRCMCEECVQ